MFGERWGWEKNEERKKGRKEGRGRKRVMIRETNSWVVRSSSGTRSSRERAVHKVTKQPNSTGRSGVSCFVRKPFPFVLVSFIPLGNRSCNWVI